LRGGQVAITAEEILAGGSIKHKINIPENILYPEGTHVQGQMIMKIQLS